MAGRLWTLEEERRVLEVARENRQYGRAWGHARMRELAIELSRTYLAVLQRAWLLGANSCTGEGRRRRRVVPA